MNGRDENAIPVFTGQFAEVDARNWMYEQLRDFDCFDNHRFAYLDDAEAMDRYEEAVIDGCCGSHDCIVKINGRLARMGCNYGH